MFEKIKYLHQHLADRFREAVRSPIGAILMYHRVASVDYDFLGPDEYTISPSDFAEQLEFLKANFNLITLADFFDGLLSNGTVPPETVVITFDDGFRDTYTRALPLLKEYQLPATVFVTTGFLSGDMVPVEFVLADLIRKLDKLTVNFFGGKEVFPVKNTADKEDCYQDLKARTKYLSPSARADLLDSLIEENAEGFAWRTGEKLTLNWDQCKKLDEQRLITVGSHGVNHSPLTTYNSREERRHELQDSKRELEDKLCHGIDFFSYPYGTSDPDIKALTKHAGYKAACVTGEDFVRKKDGNRRFKLPRISSPPHIAEIDNRLEVLRA